MTNKWNLIQQVYQALLSTYKRLILLTFISLFRNRNPFPWKQHYRIYRFLIDILKPNLQGSKPNTATSKRLCGEAMRTHTMMSEDLGADLTQLFTGC